jgi:hypothetical protein
MSSPYAPFQPPFRYDEAEGIIYDSNDRRVIDLSLSVDYTDKGNIDQHIAALMNKDVEESQ